MKRLLSVTVLAALLATPAFAAQLYLKEGGVIQAQRVWREGGKVQVLATRHTLTSFEPCEVDMKRTFPRRHRVAKSIAAVQPQAQTAAAAPAGAAANQKPVEKKGGMAFPGLPKLPERTPDSLAPSSGGGAIRQHKKEMSEKLAE